MESQPNWVRSNQHERVIFALRQDRFIEFAFCGAVIRNLVYSPPMTVTMKHIAEDLGVSIVTVSKSLRGHHDIGKETRERVLQRAKELSYRPNLAARSLVTGKSSLIGLVVPDLIHSFFAEVAKSLSSALRQHNYFLMIASSEEDPTLEAQEINHMLAHRLDALVVASSQTDPAGLRSIQSQGTPLILIDRSFHGFNCNFVGNDDEAIGTMATDHLISIGCERIAHIRGPQNSVGERRLKGYLNSLRNHGFAPLPGYVVAAPSSDVHGREHGRAALNQLLALPIRPQGIFCFNDVIAVGVIQQARASGIRIPEDLSVIGCGNLQSNDDISIPLTSIDQRSAEIGISVAKLIVQGLSRDKPVKPRKILLTPQLVMRRSSARTREEVHKPTPLRAVDVSPRTKSLTGATLARPSDGRKY